MFAQTFNSIHHYNFSTKEVFSLLCPVKEREWIDGWDFEMVYSRSGVIEKNCVFVTQFGQGIETVWQVNEYEPDISWIEFIRVTQGLFTVRISIQLHESPEGCTADLTYRYTSLSTLGKKMIESMVAQHFHEDMRYWERALNHYLETGKILAKDLVLN